MILFLRSLTSTRGGRLTLTVAQAQGSRSYQEDSFATNETSPWTLLAVFDGHVSRLTADKCSGLLPTFFMEEYELCCDARASFEKTFTKLHLATHDMRSGTTASAVFISESLDRAAVAILGDSPVLVMDKSGDLNISPEHNARSNDAEMNAAVARGADYDGSYLWDRTSDKGLQMSRALGDSECAFLSREPEIYEVELGRKSFIVVGTDGLFDPRHADLAHNARHIADLVKQGASADDLVQDALRRRTGDNVTAIVWRTH